MENERNNKVNQESDSTYHFGRNESPFGKEDISGRTDYTEYHYYQNTMDSNNEETERGNANRPGDGFTAAEPSKPKKVKREKKPSNGKVKKAGLFIASAVAFGLIAGGVMVGVNAVGDKVLGQNRRIPELATVTTTDSESDKSAGSGVADVVENAMPSIVSITNTSVQVVRSWFQSYEREVSGSGSGIIIGQTDDEILIATNNHVIEGAKEITVAFCDESAVAATVKGADSLADIAVVSINTKDMDTKTLEMIKVAALGSSDDLRVGESAIAIGNALGYGQSVTVGYISAVNREVDTEDKTLTMLQTDAAINPGNSGGALLNERGEVIGINTVKYVDSEVEGMGYAIPISSAIPIINDLMNQEVIEESEQGYLGIQGKTITDEYKDFNMPKGVYVVKIVEGSPADTCGLKAGDIITKFANREINSMEILQKVLSSKKAGEEIEMVIQRNNERGEYEEVTLKVVLGAKKDMPSSSKEESTEEADTTEQDTWQISPDEFFNDFNQFFHN